VVYKRADILFLVMGENPFPNLISASTRVREGGKIVCICTEKTGGILYSKFKREVKSKLDVKFDRISIYVDKSKEYTNRDIIKEKIVQKLEAELSLNPHIKLLELNYTGGTKLMSAVSYETIKKFDYERYSSSLNVSLTYIDSERESMYFELKKGVEGKFTAKNVKLTELEPSFNISLKDVIDLHVDLNLNNPKEKSHMGELSDKLGNLFVNIDKDEYKNRIEFFEKIESLTKKYNKDNDKFACELEKLFRKYDLLHGFKNVAEFGFQDNKNLYGYFDKTVWMEEFVLNRLIELKDEGIINDVISNIKKEKADEEQGEFEVDIAAYRKYKLFAISVTSIDKPEFAKGKLYEIKQRSKNLAGDEAGICYITLCWNTDELKNEYKNIWDNENIKNSLILGSQDLKNLKDELRDWIKGGE